LARLTAVAPFCKSKSDVEEDLAQKGLSTMLANVPGPTAWASLSVSIGRKTKLQWEPGQEGS